MAKRRFGVFSSGLLFLLGSVLLSYSQADLSVKELVEKNIQAVGGEEKISQMKNYSFKSGNRTFYMSYDGRMKIISGKEPIITEVILVDKKKVKRNCFNNITELTGLQKSRYQCLAKLRSGLFTLKKFKDTLDFKGLKSFGPKKHYMLTTNLGDLEVDFYLDHDEFTIKRLVFKGFVSSRDKYEINHDFGPCQEINGVKIPSSWFGSQVGTRGSNFKISDVKMNQTLDKDFFSNLEVNVGEVTVSQGSLKGNVIDFNVRRNNLYITTNWTDKYIQESGFKTKDKLLLQISDMKIELDFYASANEVPPRSAFPQGAKMMFLDNRRGETYLIYFYSTEFSQIVEKLEPLLPIQVKRK